MDKRQFNGGHKTAGRKPKDQELKIIESLDANINTDIAFKKLSELIELGNLQAIKLYLEYRYGKPKETKDITTTGENMIFKPIDLDVKRSVIDKNGKHLHDMKRDENGHYKQVDEPSN